MSLLQELRARGNWVRYGEGDRLYLGGLQDAALVAQVRNRKPELLEELRREVAEASRFYACPACGGFDYQPLGNDRRRCLNYDCQRIYRNVHDLRQSLPAVAQQSGCFLHRDPQTKAVRVNDIGGHGCGLHLRALDAHNRCPVSGEVIAEGGGQ